MQHGTGESSSFVVRRSSFVVDSVILECDGTLDKASEPTAGKEGAASFRTVQPYGRQYTSPWFSFSSCPRYGKIVPRFACREAPCFGKKGAGISGPVDLHS